MKYVSDPVMERDEHSKRSPLALTRVAKNQTSTIDKISLAH